MLLVRSGKYDAKPSLNISWNLNMNEEAYLTLLRQSVSGILQGHLIILYVRFPLLTEFVLIF